jgi:dTDP-4-amino-4,6-dideoxygalactose transaminase
MKKVPFNDLSRIHEPIHKKVFAQFSKVVQENRFVLNEEIGEFECLFSEFTKSKYTVSCASGTDALELILRALEIGKNDEVILPTNTFIATALAVTRCGAIPVFVDNDKFYLIDTKEVEKRITRKTKAIIAVNLYGQLANLKELNKIAKANSLKLIEDSAQSHGASNTSFSNNYSVAAAYSFYPGKNLGAWGDGGAVTTNNKKLYEKIVLLRNWGSVKKYNHLEKGFNSRLQPLQGVVLSEKIKKLESWNKQRNKIAKKYLESLSEIDSIALPKVMNENYHVWHLFVIRTKERNKILREFDTHKVEFGIHYPVPIHRQRAYKEHKQYGSNISLADQYSSQLLSLPIFPKMKDNEIERVIDTVKWYL